MQYVKGKYRLYRYEEDPKEYFIYLYNINQERGIVIYATYDYRYLINDIQYWNPKTVNKNFGDSRKGFKRIKNDIDIVIPKNSNIQMFIETDLSGDKFFISKTNSGYVVVDDELVVVNEHNMKSMMSQGMIQRIERIKLIV